MVPLVYLDTLAVPPFLRHPRASERRERVARRGAYAVSHGRSAYRTSYASIRRTCHPPPTFSPAFVFPLRLRSYAIVASCPPPLEARDRWRCKRCVVLYSVDVVAGRGSCKSWAAGALELCVPLAVGGVDRVFSVGGSIVRAASSIGSLIAYRVLFLRVLGGKRWLKRGNGFVSVIRTVPSTHTPTSVDGTTYLYNV